MSELIKANAYNIIAFIFCAICVINVAIVLWQVFSGKDLIDVLWDIYEKRKDKEDG